MKYKRKLILTFVFWGTHLLVYSQKAFDRLNLQLDSILVAEEIPGCQIVVVNSDSIIWSKNFGYSNIEKEKLVDQHTQFRIASITKTFTALAAVQLHERNIWSLEDELLTINPDARIKNKFSEPVRLIHLLEHTSGLDDLSFHEYAFSCVDCSLSESIKKIDKVKFIRWKPGKLRSYTSWGAVYLAEALERQMDMTYESYMEKEVLNPLNMERTSYFLSPELESNLAIGYDRKVPVEYDHMFDIPAGALNSSAFELSHFLRMLINRGKHQDVQIVSESSVAMMEKSHSSLFAQAGITDRYGLGLANHLFEGNLWYGHAGHTKGYRSKLYYNRENKIGYIILANTDSDINMLDAAMRRFLLKPQNVDIASSVEFDDRFLGYYNTATSRMQISRFYQYLSPFQKLEHKEGQYFLKSLFGKPKELSPIASNILYYEDQSGFGRRYFFASDEGENYMSGLQNYLQTSFISGWVRVLLPVLIIFSFFFGFLAIPVFFISKKNYIWLHLSMWASIWTFLTMLYFMFYPVVQNRAIEMLGNSTLWSKGIFIASLLFFFFSLLSSLLFIKSRKELTRSRQRLFTYLLVVFWVCIVYLSIFGIIGVQTWK